MSKWGRWGKYCAVMLVVALSVSLLAACGGKDNVGGKEEERVLRIGVTSGYSRDYGDWVRTQFTELFEWVNPNITVEFIENSDMGYVVRPMREGAEQEEQKTPLDILKEEMDGANPPDVILMSYEHMPELIREGRLQPLEALMQKSNINTDEFVPSVVDSLKKQSEDGKLYALAPLFQSSALIYNKKLFTDNNLAFPTDGMTWDQMFDLARQVARGEGNDRIYGFSFSNYRYNDLFYESQSYFAPLGVRFWDEKGEKMMVNTPEWIEGWKTIKSLKDEKILPEQPDWSQPMMEPRGPFDSNSLLSGKVAMSIINGYWELNEIINANRNAANYENFEPIDWDIVSVPYHESNPHVGGNVYLNGIMGIAANAGNPDDAWKFIEFIMSERWAQQKAKSSQEMVTWKKYNEPRHGLDYNLEAFYYNTPSRSLFDYGDQLWRTKPNIGQAQWIGQTKIQEALNGDKTIEQALQEWENEGNAILQKLSENNGSLPNDSWIGIPEEKIQIMEAAGEVFVDEAVVVDSDSEDDAGDGE